MFDPPVLLTNFQHRFIVADQIAKLGVNPSKILLEPVSRNTAPAVLTAALLIAKKDPDKQLLISPSDHLIADVMELRRSIRIAQQAVRNGNIIMFGVKPTAPCSEYGYIQTGGQISKNLKCVASFTEKPTTKQAKQFLNDESFYWNTGYFLATAKTLIDCAQIHYPDLLALCRQCISHSTENVNNTKLDKPTFEQIENISIDFAIIEKHHDLVFTELKTSWSDMGSWSCMIERASKNDEGNHNNGSAIFEDARNCFVHSDNETTVAVLGLNDVVTIATKNAVFVTTKERANDVSRIANRMNVPGDEAAHLNHTTYRPWGKFEYLKREDGYQVKQLRINPNSSISIQSHNHRAEHWIIVSGSILVTINDRSFQLKKNQSVFIPQNAVHKIENPFSTPATLIEVQTGTYLGEDDIVRYDEGCINSQLTSDRP